MNTNMTTIEQIKRNSMTGNNRRKECVSTTMMNSKRLKHGGAVVTSKPTTLDDYASCQITLNQNIRGTNEESLKDSEIEQLITEKLNQRYQSRKKPQQSTQNGFMRSTINPFEEQDGGSMKRQPSRAESVPKARAQNPQKRSNNAHQALN